MESNFASLYLVITFDFEDEITQMKIEQKMFAVRCDCQFSERYTGSVHLICNDILGRLRLQTFYIQKWSKLSPLSNCKARNEE